MQTAAELKQRIDKACTTANYHYGEYIRATNRLEDLKEQLYATENGEFIASLEHLTEVGASELPPEGVTPNSEVALFLLRLVWAVDPSLVVMERDSETTMRLIDFMRFVATQNCGFSEGSGVNGFVSQPNPYQSFYMRDHGVGRMFYIPFTDQQARLYEKVLRGAGFLGSWG